MESQSQPGSISPAEGYSNEATYTVRHYFGSDESAHSMIVSTLARTRNDEQVSEEVSAFVWAKLWQEQPFLAPVELFRRDLIGTALEQVNWGEIIEHYRKLY